VKRTIFENTNPNNMIFNVPVEEGPDVEDNMCAMIGDAVARHVAGLTPSERQCWEYYVLNGNQHLFSFVPSPKHVDPDEYNLSTEDISAEEQMGSDEATEAELEALSQKEWGAIAAKLRSNRPDLANVQDEILAEAVESEKERRARSHDAYDRAVELIPFQDWEENPGMFTHYDMPSTPKNIAVYCGNTQQMFYDDFPADHPDANIMNQYLTMMNKEDIELTERYGDFILNWLSQQGFRDEFCYKVLVKLTSYLVEGQKDPGEITRKALNLIDDSARKLFAQKAKDALAADAMHQLLLTKEADWQAQHDEGVTVLPLIKQFGQILFSQFRKGMKKHHWDYYRKLKSQYTNALIVRGVDINSCNLSSLAIALEVPRSMAIDIWMSRPFLTKHELVKREATEYEVVYEDGELKKKEIKVQRGWLAHDAVVEKGDIEEIYQQIKARVELAKKTNDIKALTSFSQDLLKRQKEAKDGFSPREWSSVWTMYRAEKNAILTSRGPNE
jgi:hypothetical protein